MPPTRTIPPAKAVKVGHSVCIFHCILLIVNQTERTHEENQERAYIAASRRSDRSIEARVESARRASDIHKRRTGRSLRVREEDVVNEEMYEEEDDDLPLQYRQLTAHLRTGNPDFNNRLAAYLTNHVAMRSALEQSISNSYAQQYPNAPQFAPQYSSVFPSPMLAHQQQQQQSQQQIMQPQPSQNPPVYRHAPYPTPRQQQQSFPQPHQHIQSASIATPQEVPGPIPTVPLIKTESSVQAKTPLSATSAVPPQRPSFPQGSFDQQFQPKNEFPSFDMYAFNNNNNFGAFSTVPPLPAESQGFLGSTFPFNDPLTSMMMAGSNGLPGNYYNSSTNQPFPQNLSSGKQQTHPSFDGLTSTLAPSALDLSQGGQDFAQNTNYYTDAIKASSNSATPTGTPGFWNEFVDSDQWDPPSSQKSQ
jgi:hypothetical protein